MSYSPACDSPVAFGLNGISFFLPISGAGCAALLVLLLILAVFGKLLRLRFSDAPPRVGGMVDEPLFPAYDWLYRKAAAADARTS